MALTLFWLINMFEKGNYDSFFHPKFQRIPIGFAALEGISKLQRFRENENGVSFTISKDNVNFYLPVQLK